jgi:hypothetical protein
MFLRPHEGQRPIIQECGPVILAADARHLAMRYVTNSVYRISHTWVITRSHNFSTTSAVVGRGMQHPFEFRIGKVDTNYKTTAMAMRTLLAVAFLLVCYRCSLRPLLGLINRVNSYVVADSNLG